MRTSQDTIASKRCAKDEIIACQIGDRAAANQSHRGAVTLTDGEVPLLDGRQGL